jgi:hypothetical protein
MFAWCQENTSVHKFRFLADDDNDRIYSLTFKRRIKSHLPFEGIIRSSPYSPHFQVKG